LCGLDLDGFDVTVISSDTHLKERHIERVKCRAQFETAGFLYNVLDVDDQTFNCGFTWHHWRNSLWRFPPTPDEQIMTYQSTAELPEADREVDEGLRLVKLFRRIKNPPDRRKLLEFAEQLALRRGRE